MLAPEAVVSALVLRVVEAPKRWFMQPPSRIVVDAASVALCLDAGWMLTDSAVLTALAARLGCGGGGQLDSVVARLHDTGRDLVIDGLTPSAATPQLLQWLSTLPVACTVTAAFEPYCAGWDVQHPQADLSPQWEWPNEFVILSLLTEWDLELADALCGNGQALVAHAQHACAIYKKGAVFAWTQAARADIQRRVDQPALENSMQQLLTYIEQRPESESPRWQLGAVDARASLLGIVHASQRFRNRQRAAALLHMQVLWAIDVRLPIGTMLEPAAHSDPLRRAALRLLVGDKASAFTLLASTDVLSGLDEVRRQSMLIPLLLERAQPIEPWIERFAVLVSEQRIAFPLLEGELAHLRAMQAARNNQAHEARAWLRKSVLCAHSEPALVTAAWHLFAEWTLAWAEEGSAADAMFLTFRSYDEMPDRDDAVGGTVSVDRSVARLEALPLEELLACGQLIIASFELAVSLEQARAGDCERAEATRMSALARLALLVASQGMTAQRVENARSLWKALTPTEAPQTAANADLVIGPGCEWFRVRHQDPVSLKQRRVLRALLQELARARTNGKPITQSELIQAIWPGEHAQPEHLRNRLAVQLSLLRECGLRAWVTTVSLPGQSGYWLDPGADILALAD